MGLVISMAAELIVVGLAIWKVWDLLEEHL